MLTRPLRREDGRLDPTLPAADLERPSAPTSRGPARSSSSADERLVVGGGVGRAVRGPATRPGAIVRHGREPALATADGRLVLHRVTPQGRKPMRGEDWLRGRRDVALSRTPPDPCQNRRDDRAHAAGRGPVQGAAPRTRATTPRDERPGTRRPRRRRAARLVRRPRRARVPGPPGHGRRVGQPATRRSRTSRRSRPPLRGGPRRRRSGSTPSTTPTSGSPTAA